MKHPLISYLFILFIAVVFTNWFSSCANKIPPTGGLRDSLPPRLIEAIPKDSSTKFSTKRITLTFDEYVTVDNPQDNVIVSNPINTPGIESKLHEVTIRLKDSLEPNTTYTINFGRGLKDVNEGNVDSAFAYVFTTGSQLDHNKINGKVLLAESGKVDSTLLVVLQTNLSDTAIRKNPPRYYTRLTGKGNFSFFNLPTDTFNVFVVPGDYTKRYDDSTKLFAFLPQPLIVRDSNSAPLTLYAYQEFKDTEKKPVTGTSSTSRSATTKKPKPKKDSSLKVTADLDNGKQDFLKSLVLSFSDTLRNFDSSKFHFSDTNYTPLPGALSITPDSTNTGLSLAYKWKENTPYKLVIEKDAVSDSSGFTLAQNDTLSFSTLRESDYGSIRMRFQNLDTSKHPVLLLIQNEKIVQSKSLNTYEWYQKFIRPGEYEIRMLYDTNRNGVWDAGSYDVKREPEVVRQLNYKGNNRITIRANWDNETNITL